MRVRFHDSGAGPEEGEDHLRVSYAPARRPGLQLLRWYAVAAVLALVLAVLALTVLGGALCPK